MRALFLSTALLILPLSAAAESQSERFEALTSDMTRVMWGMMAREVEQEGGDGAPMRAAIEKFAWTDKMATASNCVLGRYNDEIGSDAVDALFDRMEGMISDMEDMTLTQFSDELDPEEMMPEGLTEDESLAINEECNMTDAQLEMMAQTGFTEAMMGAMAATQ